MYVASALLILIGLPLIAVGNQSIKQRRLVLIDKYNSIITLTMKSSDRSTASSIDNTDTTTTTARTSRSLANQLCLNVTNDDDDDDNSNNKSGIHDLTQPLLNNTLDISSASSNFTDVSPNPDDDHYSLIRGNDIWENITLSRENSIVDNLSNADELSSSSQQHKQSMWSRCSFRNALLMSLQVMTFTRMITVMYTPRSESHNDHCSNSSSSSSSVNEIVDDDKVAPTAVNYVDADGGDIDNGVLHRHSNSSHLEPIIVSHSALK